MNADERSEVSDIAGRLRTYSDGLRSVHAGYALSIGELADRLDSLSDGGYSGFDWGSVLDALLDSDPELAGQVARYIGRDSA